MMMGWEEPEELFVPTGGTGPRAAGGSDIGSRRADNEDAQLCDAARGLFLIADGMGGHAAGEQASALAVQTLDTELSAVRLDAAIAAGADAARALVTEALLAADAAITRAGEHHPEWKDMGTTAVVACLAGDALYLAHVGDSRAYLLRDGEIRALTRDHTVAMTLVDDGDITLEEARTHPLRNRLSQVLGGHGALHPDFAHLPVRPGDRILLCTDGLYDMLTDEEIAEIVNFSASPDEAVYALIAAADDAGGRDNITVVAVFV
ncbi:MAG TPA: Stp1/IreP family PP2C-type Ser/Thr phosphatase [Armatimonadota bacterium]|nr:Stp1/IreP family PP2C-type Ser/Thr phosphatase [Armatimonadota bacterium]